MPAQRRLARDLRQRINDISHSHTYSRDHERILQARVNVQAEIQHQYQRLQQLRRERRRLEARLRDLHDAPNRTDRTAQREEASLIHGSLHTLQREAFHDYNEITMTLAARVQSHLLQSLSSPDVQVSVELNNPSHDFVPSPTISTLDRLSNAGTQLAPFQRDLPSSVLGDSSTEIPAPWGSFHQLHRVGEPHRSSSSFRSMDFGSSPGKCCAMTSCSGSYAVT